MTKFAVVTVVREGRAFIGVRHDPSQGVEAQCTWNFMGPLLTPIQFGLVRQILAW